MSVRLIPFLGSPTVTIFKDSESSANGHGVPYDKKRLDSAYCSRGQKCKGNVLWISRGPELRPSDLSDARVIREGPTTADDYIDISPFYGMAPATVSGYKTCLRADPPTDYRLQYGGQASSLWIHSAAHHREREDASLRFKS